MIKIFLYMQYLMWLVKKIKEKPGSEITLTNNEIMTAGSPLMKVVLTPLAKSVLIPLGLSAGIAAAFAAIQIYIYIYIDQVQKHW